jgi:mannosylfructose-phosphate synthase
MELARSFARLGWEVDVWTRQFEDQPAVEEVAAGLRVLRVPCGGRCFIPKEQLWAHIPEWCENALRFMREEAGTYDFINSHYWDAGIAGQHLSDVLGIRHVHTPHSLGRWKRDCMLADFPGGEEDLDRRYNFELRIREETRIVSQCDLVVATTAEQHRLLVTDYLADASRTITLPPGYDDSRFYPIGPARRDSLRRSLGFDSPTILAVGRLARNKGYDLLLDGFQCLLKRMPEAQLALAAGGAHPTDAEKAALAQLQSQADRLGVASRVKFLGYVPDETLADHYRAADVYILPSRYEPFGMTAIEAMACGTPSVVTIHGGLYRLLTFGRHALFTDPVDPEDVGVMLAKVLKHPRLRHRLARMGSHKARSLFTWTAIAQQLAAQIEERHTPAFALHDTDWDEPWNDGD